MATRAENLLTARTALGLLFAAGFGAAGTWVAQGDGSPADFAVTQSDVQVLGGAASATVTAWAVQCEAQGDLTVRRVVFSNLPGARYYVTDSGTCGRVLSSGEASAFVSFVQANFPDVTADDTVILSSSDGQVYDRISLVVAAVE